MCIGQIPKAFRKKQLLVAEISSCFVAARWTARGAAMGWSISPPVIHQEKKYMMTSSDNSLTIG
jgi:hypothetical protein